MTLYYSTHYYSLLEKYIVHYLSHYLMCPEKRSRQFLNMHLETWQK